MKSKKVKVLFVILCLVILGIFIIVIHFLVSCHPPLKEISKARALLMEAQKAGAQRYAPERYREAENLLAQVQAEAKTQCKKSWETVKLAQQKAREAKEDALKGKAQAKVAALKAIHAAQEALKEAREAGAPQYAPDLYREAENLLKKSQEDYRGENYIGSKEEANRSAQLALKAKETAIEVKEELARRQRAEPTTYVVKRGECLWIISSYPQIYGDPFLWPLIYWANKVQIHDPDLIYPGQEFVIPRNFSHRERDRAVCFSKHRGPWSLFDGK